MDFVQTNVVVLRSGLEPGEPVVISDLPFAVEGMRLATVVDQWRRTAWRPRRLSGDRLMIGFFAGHPTAAKSADAGII